ncbi:hypothetical protein D3C87_1839770 [compost metagenome]
MDEERRNGSRDHQHHPDLAEQPVDGGSLGAQEDEGAENGCGHDGGDMELHGERCV